MALTIATLVNPIIAKAVNEVADLLKEEACKVLGVNKKLHRLQRRLERISGVIQEAETKASRDADASKWLKVLKDVMYDADDILDLCKTKVGSPKNHQPSTSVSIFFANLKFRHEIAKKLEKLDDRLKEIIEDNAISKLVPTTNSVVLVSGVNPLQTSHVVVESDTVGTAIEESTRRLVESISKEEAEECRFFGIVGMGGIGKTTLARRVFNDETISSSFSKRIWLCVTKNFDEIELLKELIRSAGGSYGEAKSKAELEPILAYVIPSRFLLVLDDLWTADLWENLLRNPLTSRKVGGRILVTTRDENVVTTISIHVKIHRVGKMKNHDGWTMLCKRVFEGDEEKIVGLEDVGMKIVDKCDGLPLAIKVAAGVLRSKERTLAGWERVLQSATWSMTDLEKELPKALYLSYEDLSSDLKNCFLYCSLLPEGRTMFCKDLVRYWMAEGFLRRQGKEVMQELGEEYYKELISRSLLQPHPKSRDNAECSMHDLLHTLGRVLTRDENVSGSAQILGTKTSTKVRRLAVTNMTERAVTNEIIKQGCLRTLMLFTSSASKTFGDDLFRRLPCLRVLDLSNTGIETVPDSLDKLLHLRLLNLARTKIKKLPESLGSLRNLQTLDVSRCTCLQELPRGVTRLCNLSCLCLNGTDLSHVPKGIGKLKHLTHLDGLVLGNNSSAGDRRKGCSLEDVQSLSNLRVLQLEKLERAQTGGALALANSSFLSDLFLSCSQPPDRNLPTYTEDEIQRTGEIHQELFPPPSLRRLGIHGYFGRRFPRWMLSSSLGTCFPNLKFVTLFYCRSCPGLPPLGQLPQLTSLHIKGADAIVEIGPEFLGLGASSVEPFPKLEILRMEEMHNWEKWSFGGVEDGFSGINPTPKLLPRLKRLSIIDCPSLRALPRGLRHASSLQILRIEGVRRLETVEELPSVGSVTLKHNPNLKSLSLPGVKELGIVDCPSLEHVEQVERLRSLMLVHSPSELIPEENTDSRKAAAQLLKSKLPVWLCELVKQRLRSQAHTPAALQDLQFYLFCPYGMFLRCLRDGPDWPVIQQMSMVSAWTCDGYPYWIRYTRMPQTYETNIHPELQQVVVEVTSKRPQIVQVVSDETSQS